MKTGKHRKPRASLPDVVPRQLNDDILLFILSLSSLDSAASMMATCNFLYHEGAKIILRDTPMSFGQDTSEHRALALLRFIQAEDLSRCSHIRMLHVMMPSVPDAIAEALIQLVPHMTSLKVLFVAIEDALKSHPDLLPAFSSLRSVQNVLLANAGERSCELLRALQSQLVEASIYFDSMGTATALSSKDESHPLVMLQRSAPTLVTLVTGFLVDNNIQLVFFRSPDVAYLNMHTLVLHECASLTLAPYIKAFPNLTHLCLRYEDSGTWADSPPGGLPIPVPSLSQFQREMNLTLHRRLAPTGESYAWTQLEEYIGPLTDLWIFGLTCRITRLTLEDTPATRGARALTDVLTYARPRDLSVVFRRCSLTDVLATDFLDGLRSEGAAGLRSLMFAVWVREGDRDLHVGRALDEIAATLSRLNLVRLNIEINDGGLDGEPEETWDGHDLLFPWPEPGAGTTGAAVPPVDAHTVTPRTPMRNSESGTAPANQDGVSPSPQVYASNSSDSASNSSSDQEQDSESEPLSLGERTLDAINVPALAARLADAIPTLENALIMVQRPRRSGTRLRVRTALFGRGVEGKSVHEWREVGGVLYQETEGYGV